MTKLITASVLAFERNLDVSDAVFSQLNSADANPIATPVKVKEKSVRGTISNRLKSAISADPVKLDAEIEKANLQTVDVAMLDSNNDTLQVNFSCKVLPFNGSPSVCNDQDYQIAVEQVVASYLDEHSMVELARRYATNIVNARWLWRNRIGSESIQVTVKCKLDGNIQQIALDNTRTMSLRNFDEQSEGKSEGIKQITDWIVSGLKGDAFIMLQVEAKAYVGTGQEVYPSQE
ncbi:MAG: type I-F CRISPR-associated protein Csy3, partial [Shewanella sp.]|nr:type I-F CRISPR-associated protein Csy3 [Shewanella sp.]